MWELPYLLCSPPLCILFRTRSGVVIYPLFLVLYKLLIKLRIEIVEILFIQLGLYLFQRLPETLKMNDFPGAEKFKGFSYLRVFNDADQVVIRGSGEPLRDQKAAASPFDRRYQLRRKLGFAEGNPFQ